MTDQQHLITPSQDQVYKWWEEACKRPSSFYEKLDYVAEQAAQWGWQQRDARVPGELQEARDEELEACVKWLSHESPFSERLRAARRPKPPSLKEQALEELESIMDELHEATDSAFTASAIRRALEQLND